MTIPTISNAPIKSNGFTITFKLSDVIKHPYSDNPPAEIISGHKVYRLFRTDFITEEVIYTRQQQQPAAEAQAPQPEAQAQAPQANPDRMTAAELRQEFKHLEEMLSDQQQQINRLSNSLVQMQEGLTHAAATSSQATGNTAASAVLMDKITLDFVDGKPVYKARGGKFQKWGVRIWPETLPSIIDPDSLKPGSNTLTPPIMMIVELTDEGTPRKVTGLG